VLSRSLLGVIVVVAALGAARAEVRLPALISEHMVVQRGTPVHVWGTAAPAETVSVSFRGETQRAAADELGRWSLHLRPGGAGGPFEMEVQGSNRIVFRDVWAGDVWVASGQSNMEFALKEANDGKREIATANWPQIRLFQVEQAVSDYPRPDLSTKRGWTACTPESAAGFSAVAYFFGREIHQKQQAPIGLIVSSWGGTPAEAWTSLGTLAADASLMPVFAQRAQMADARVETQLTIEKETREIQEAIRRAKAEGKPAPWLPWHPDFRAWAPAALYNAMIAPLSPFPIRGAIWYQGESNSPPEKARLYARLFRSLIEDWRRSWGQADLPFLFVQIANWESTDDWPEVREAQRQALALRNTGMAVTIDIGDRVDIHPRNKQEVGHRLALAARAIVYGESVEYSGPALSRLSAEDHGLRVWFDHQTGGLQARGGRLDGFEVAGLDGLFRPAQARIDGPSVVVESNAVTSPVWVRYAWSSNPPCTLYNGEGLPASPFRARLSP